MDTTQKQDITHLGPDALGDIIFNDPYLLENIFHPELVSTLKSRVNFTDEQLSAFLHDRADYEDDLNEEL